SGQVLRGVEGDRGCRRADAGMAGIDGEVGGIDRSIRGKGERPGFDVQGVVISRAGASNIAEADEPGGDKPVDMDRDRVVGIAASGAVVGAGVQDEVGDVLELQVGHRYPAAGSVDDVQPRSAQAVHVNSIRAVGGGVSEGQERVGMNIVVAVVQAGEIDV